MSQSLSQLFTHIIFSTKKRRPFLQDIDIQNRMHCYIEAICTKQHCIPIRIGGMEDHVHILVKLDKNISLADLVEEIKKSSSKWIKSLAVSESDRLNSFYWQSGYGAFSVSQSQLESVKLYIQNQQKHHEKQDFQTEFRNFLVRHKIAYDEKFVWG